MTTRKVLGRRIDKTTMVVVYISIASALMLTLLNNQKLSNFQPYSLYVSGKSFSYNTTSPAVVMPRR
jgi:hypothetical protein